MRSITVSSKKTVESMISCFRINRLDNVATALHDVVAGGTEVTVLGESSQALRALEPVKLGHKIALVDIPEGSQIIKFGVAIGSATRRIRAGEWVHLHNCASGFDERSQTLDLQTGASTDVTYE
jgi:altronate dehydratase small subunit